METAQTTIENQGTIDISKLVPLVRSELSVSQEHFGQLLRVSGRSVARWEKERKAPMKYETRERLTQLKKITTIGRKVYTPKGLNEFLSTPLSVFGGKTGYDMISLNENEAVISALAADYEGIGF